MPHALIRAMKSPMCCTQAAEVHLREDQQAGHECKGEADHTPSQEPHKEEEHQSCSNAPLLLSIPSVASSSTHQLHTKGKPGWFAKTILCAVFSSVLVPVLAVGGCIQVIDAFR